MIRYNSAALFNVVPLAAFAFTLNYPRDITWPTFANKISREGFTRSASESSRPLQLDLFTVDVCSWTL